MADTEESDLASVSSRLPFPSVRVSCFPVSHFAHSPELVHLPGHNIFLKSILIFTTLFLSPSRFSLRDYYWWDLFRRVLRQASIREEAGTCSWEQERRHTMGTVDGRDHPAALSHKSTPNRLWLCPSCSHMQRAHCLVIDYVFSAYETQATHRLFLLLLQLYITVAITVSFVFVLWNV